MVEKENEIPPKAENSGIFCVNLPYISLADSTNTSLTKKSLYGPQNINT